MTEQDLSFYNSLSYKITLSVSMAVFFFVFLSFFLPFGVDNYNPRHQYTWEFIGSMVLHMSVSLLITLLNELVLRQRIFRAVTYPRLIAWSIWTLILLGTVNFFVYNKLGNWHDFHLDSALSFILNCSSVFIFPMTGTFFFFRFRSLQQRFHMQLEDKRSQVDPDQFIHFAGQGTHDHITLSLSDFLYAKAQDNYVELHYLTGEKPGKKLIRTSLTRLAESIEHKAIVRSHRSYLVNLYHVRSISSSSGGYKLQIHQTDTPLPVSKSYQEDVLPLLEQVKDFA